MDYVNQITILLFALFISGYFIDADPLGTLSGPGVVRTVKGRNVTLQWKLGINEKDILSLKCFAQNQTTHKIDLLHRLNTGLEIKKEYPDINRTSVMELENGTFGIVIYDVQESDVDYNFSCSIFTDKSYSASGCIVLDDIIDIEITTKNEFNLSLPSLKCDVITTSSPEISRTESIYTWYYGNKSDVIVGNLSVLDLGSLNTTLSSDEPFRCYVKYGAAKNTSEPYYYQQNRNQNIEHSSESTFTEERTETDTRENNPQITYVILIVVLVSAIVSSSLAYFIWRRKCKRKKESTTGALPTTIYQLQRASNSVQDPGACNQLTTHGDVVATYPDEDTYSYIRELHIVSENLSQNITHKDNCKSMEACETGLVEQETTFDVTISTGKQQDEESMPNLQIELLHTDCKLPHSLESIRAESRITKFSDNCDEIESPFIDYENDNAAMNVKGIIPGSDVCSEGSAESDHVELLDNKQYEPFDKAVKASGTSVDDEERSMVSRSWKGFKESCNSVISNARSSQNIPRTKFSNQSSSCTLPNSANISSDAEDRSCDHEQLNVYKLAGNIDDSNHGNVQMQKTMFSSLHDTYTMVSNSNKSNKQTDMSCDHGHLDVYHLARDTNGSGHFEIGTKNSNEEICSSRDQKQLDVYHLAGDICDSNHANIGDEAMSDTKSSSHDIDHTSPYNRNKSSKKEGMSHDHGHVHVYYSAGDDFGSQQNR